MRSGSFRRTSFLEKHLLCAQLWAHARAAVQRAELAAPLARLNTSLS
jgi:hypothetical protein